MTEATGRNRKPARRGFAAMDKERQREIARKGGASVPDDKRSFSQDRIWPPRPGARAAKPATAAAAAASRSRAPPTPSAAQPPAFGNWPPRHSAGSAIARQRQACSRKTAKPGSGLTHWPPTRQPARSARPEKPSSVNL